MKVFLVYDHETPEDFLRIMSKMTPGRSGRWKDMEATTNPNEADWFVVIDSTYRSLPLDRTLFVGAHPAIPTSNGYRNNTDKPHRLDCSETFGFGEWWINYDYDTLKTLQPPQKKETLCCIMSDAESTLDHKLRKSYMDRYCKKHDIRLYGRIKPTESTKRCYRGELGSNTPKTYWFGKEEVIRDHKYALEFDNGPTKHYFSERIFDDILLWTTPILVIGCTNLEDYLPTGSFHYASLDKDGDDVQDIIKLEPSIEKLKEARELLLDKYNLWPRVYEYIRQL